MTFTTRFVLGSIAIAAALTAVSPAIAQDCQNGREIVRTQQTVRINNPGGTVKRVSYVDGTGTVIRQQTVVIPANRNW